MKKYNLLHKTYRWKDIIPNIDAETCVLLNNGEDSYILAWGIEKEFVFNSAAKKETFNSYLDSLPKEYLFGYFGYDLKNELEPKLKSSNKDILDFNDSYFFQPKNILFLKNSRSIYYGSSSLQDVESLLNGVPTNSSKEKESYIELEPNLSRKEYLENIQKIKQHIQQGDIYEMNYCINYSAVSNNFSPFESYLRLSELTEAPFSVYANFEKHSILSASPERFIKKMGNTISSQPIKGTAKRGKSLQEDDKIAEELERDEKERSENIMIVDLVRNDLSKIATRSSVSVESLCEVHRFKTVHQLISTISCSIDDNIKISQIIDALFPMGSMTGAPKINAMRLSEKYENFKRGLYSGSIGYFDPNGNFDFNVVIRSVLHNKDSGAVSCSIGGAITSKSNPEQEYQECILKLEALKKSLC